MLCTFSVGFSCFTGRLLLYWIHIHPYNCLESPLVEELHGDMGSRDVEAFVVVIVAMCLNILIYDSYDHCRRAGSFSMRSKKSRSALSFFQSHDLMKALKGVDNEVYKFLLMYIIYNHDFKRHRASK